MGTDLVSDPLAVVSIGITSPVGVFPLNQSVSLSQMVSLLFLTGEAAICILCTAMPVRDY